MFGTIRALLSLVRPLNLLITFLSIVVAAVLAGGGRDDAVPILFAACAGVAVAAGANAINDRFDVEIDRINRPDRPIPRGDLTTSDALRVWQVTSVLGVLLAWAIGVWPFGIVLFAIPLLYWYSRALKGTPLVGNVVVGGMTGLAFIFGASAVGSIENGFIPALFAFLVNLAREVVKDIEDREGDSRSQASTFPLRFGLRPARSVTSIALIALVGVTLVVELQNVYRPPYLAIVALADVLLVYVAFAVWRSEAPEAMRRLSQVLKAAMVVGLAAIYFGRVGP